MRHLKRLTRAWLFLALLAALLPACSTLAYRQVQKDFAQAVEADNEWSVSPFGGNTATALYGAVRESLDDAYIAGLDQRLQANAWMIRSVSGWRTGRLREANSEAAKGLELAAAHARGSRDHVVLEMLDGLIVDSELRAAFRDDGESVDGARYTDHYAADFKTALAALGAAADVQGEATPPDIGWYLAYQRWRVLQNWRTVITSIVDDDERDRANDDAERTAPSGLKAAADQARDSIPAHHPLRALIQAQGGG